MRPILIIDGFNFFMRHFMVNEMVTTSGEPCGGVVGFIKGLNALVMQFSPERVYVVWEQGGGSPWRRKLLPTYKANRSKMKSEFQGVNAQTGTLPSKKWIKDDIQNKLTQNKILVDALKCLPVCQIYVPETECDDIIGYMIRSKLKSVNAMKIIVSSDRDFYQLLDDTDVKIFNPADKCLHTGPIVKVKVSPKEHIEIPARNYALVRTLTGDASDNIEGVAGMGFKTAVKLFPGLLDPSNDYTIQGLTEVARSHLNDKKPLKAWTAIASSEELIRRNWKLMFLGTETLAYNQMTKIDYVIDNFEPKANKLLLIKTLLGAQIISDINYDSLIYQMQLSLLFE